MSVSKTIGAVALALATVFAPSANAGLFSSKPDEKPAASQTVVDIRQVAEQFYAKSMKGPDDIRKSLSGYDRNQLTEIVRHYDTLTREDLRVADEVGRSLAWKKNTPTIDEIKNGDIKARYQQLQNDINQAKGVPYDLQRAASKDVRAISRKNQETVSSTVNDMKIKLIEEEKRKNEARYRIF